MVPGATDPCATWLIQNGANSACGRFVIQLARAKGLRTVNVVRREGLAEELEKLGADLVVIDDDRGPERVQRGAGPPEIAFDAVGAASAARLAHVLAPGGHLLSYGMASGRAAEISTMHLMFEDIVHRGFLMDRALQRRGLDHQRRLFADLSTMIATNQVRAAIAGAYSLDAHAAAIDHAARSGAAREGKVILLPTAAKS